MIQQEVLKALLAGTERRPLPEDCSALAMLSLAGQALRFERPAMPVSFAVEPEIRDERAILPDKLRRPLVRLLMSSKASERALARQFDALRMRPHPFDLPHMEAFVRSYAERLGPTAQHWIDRQRPASETPGYFDEESLNDSNWANATLSRRARFLDERRRTDAAASRELLESVWAQQPADARFRLLQVLETGLNSDDQPFLASLEKDRAPRVRSLAARFLARLGAANQNPALQACLERITRTQAGLLRRRTVLQLDVPANLKDHAVSRWVRDIFNEVSFGELAKALDLSEGNLIEAAAKQDDLLLGLAVIATNECRLELLEKVASLLPNLSQRTFESGLDDLGRMTVAERQRWMDTLARDLPAEYSLWEWLDRVADCEAPPSLMTAALQAKLPDRTPGLEAAWMELLAALCPGPQRRALREYLSTFDSMLTGNAFMLLDILDGMENDHNHG